MYFPMMTSCIYRLECLDLEIKDFYIGSTVDLKERIKQHKHDCKTSNSKVYTFIREHGGMDNWKFDIELLMTGYDKETRREWEQNYIDCLKPSLNSNNAKGLDMENRKKKHGEYCKEYYLDNKEKMNQNSKQYYLANKEKVKQQNKQYYLANKEKWIKVKII